MSDQFFNLITQKKQQELQSSHFQSIEEYNADKLINEEANIHSRYYAKLEQPSVRQINIPNQERTIIPTINDDGLGKKAKEKLRKRTLKNFKEGEDVVGRYATVQTAPLMRSMKKNVAEVKKQQAMEQTDIIALSDLVIPSDIFDVEITREHSHFDVKKALVIKEKLQKIADYKNEHATDYELLDFDTYVKLEALLDMKVPFETTLRTVLGANGLSENGEPLSEEESKNYRYEYSYVKESYRETVESRTRLRDKREELKNERKESALKFGRFQQRKEFVRDSLLRDWRQTYELYKKEGEEFTPIPDGYLGTPFYSRVVYRLKDNEPADSYQMLKTSMDAYKLSKENFVGAERDETFERLKKDVEPMVTYYRENLSVMAKKIEGKSITGINAMLDELLEFEMTLQHLTDIIKLKNTEGVDIGEALGISKYEMSIMADEMQYLASVRRNMELLDGARAANAGVKFRLSELSVALRNKAISHVDENGIVDPAGFLEETKRNFENNRTSFVVGEDANVQRKIREIDEEKTRLEQIRQKEELFDREKNVDLSRIKARLTADMERSMQGGQEEDTREFAQKDITRLWELFRASGIKIPGKYINGEEKKTQDDFKRMLRELFGVQTPTMDFTAERLEENIRMDERTLESVEQLLEHYDEEHIMTFLEPILNYDIEGYMREFDKAMLEGDTARRVRRVKEIMDESHPVLGLYQWGQVSKIADRLSPENKTKVLAAFARFDAGSRFISSFAMPTGISATEYTEIDIPRVKECLDATEKNDKFAAAYEQGKTEYLQAHPLVSYEQEYLKNLKFSGASGLAGAQTEWDKPYQLPISQDEMNKIAGLDSEFVKELAQKVANFSFLDEYGRARTLGISDANEVLEFGQKDFVYYSEMSRYAKMFMMTKDCDEKKLRKIIGKKKTDEILANCQKILAILSGLTDRLFNPNALPSQMRSSHRTLTGESMEQVMEQREEEKKAFQLHRVERMKKFFA